LVGATLLAAAPAFAADLAVKAPPRVAPAYLDEWSGVYVGIEGGWGWGRQTFDATSIGGFGGTGNIDRILNAPVNQVNVLFPGFDLSGPDSIRQNGGLVGGFAGVQKQMGNWVLGLEADVDASWIKGSFDAVSVRRENVSAFVFVGAPVSLLLREQFPTVVTRTLSVESKVDELASVRGKIGFTPAPNWLLYATGGVAFAHKVDNIDATESFAIGNTLFSRTVSHTGGATLVGAAVGAGIDWKMPIPNWIFGVEYLHYEFPKHTISLVDSLGSGATAFTTGRETVDAVKGRISYLFPIH
jgi:outer membrane immunogenic protein